MTSQWTTPVLLCALLASPACEREQKRFPPKPLVSMAPECQPEAEMDVVPAKSNPDSQEFTLEQLEVRLAALEAAPAGSAQVVLRITNRGTEPAEVVTVFTPFERRKRFFMTVLDARGQRIEAKTKAEAGPMPGPEDRRTLAPGAVMETTVDLRTDHDLPAGDYTVQFKGHPLVNHLPDSPPLALTLP